MHKDISIWMPLYIGDLQAKFARMTAEQIGAALLLMMDFWKNGAIPHDLATVCSITKLSQHIKAKTLLNTLMALEWKDQKLRSLERNELLKTVKRLGRTLWKKWSGYHRRSLVETKMHCIKLLGDKLTARSFSSQVNEIHARIAQPAP